MSVLKKLLPIMLVFLVMVAVVACNSNNEEQKECDHGITLTAIENVYYTGTEAEWQALVENGLGAYNNTLTNALITFGYVIN